MKTNTTSLILLPLLFLAACSDSSQSGSDGSDLSDGWIALFDGKSTSGWRGYNGIEMDGAWVVEDGALHLVHREKGSPQVSIITEGQYADFDLRFEWKVEAGTNSGVMFRVGEGPAKPHLTGPEYQVLDNLGFRNGKGLPVTPREYTATHYAVEVATSDETKPIGEWNSSRIVAKGNHVEYWLNDVMTASYEINSPKWKDQVANSKFNSWEHYATLSKGHISLQDHGHRVWFRNLKIKEL